MQWLWIRDNFWSEAIAGIAKTLSEHRIYLLLHSYLINNVYH